MQRKSRQSSTVTGQSIAPPVAGFPSTQGMNFNRISFSLLHFFPLLLPDNAHIRQFHLRMAVTLVPWRFLAGLDRFGRTPLDAGETLLAVVQPDGSARLQIDVSTRTNRFTDAAKVAFFIDPETLIHRRNMRKCESVEPCKQDILPQGSPLDRPLFSLGDGIDDRFYLLHRR
jgi:hypothetical protein